MKSTVGGGDFGLVSRGKVRGGERGRRWKEKGMERRSGVVEVGGRR